jgi:hypothetical protein
VSFNGISTFWTPVRGPQGGGNLVRAVRSELPIEQAEFSRVTATAAALRIDRRKTSNWYGFRISKLDLHRLRPAQFSSAEWDSARRSHGYKLRRCRARDLRNRHTGREIVISRYFLRRRAGWNRDHCGFRHLGVRLFDPVEICSTTSGQKNERPSNLGTAGHQFNDVSSNVMKSKNSAFTVGVIDTKRAAIDLPPHRFTRFSDYTEPCIARTPITYATTTATEAVGDR